MYVTCWPSEAPAAADAIGSWRAALALGYARRGEATVPVLRRHRGPLRVQKHFHPEGPAVCQHIIVHPPGGIAGGDALRIDVEVGAAAHALITSPGAAKWYRGRAEASQQLRLQVASGGVLEWLPQETILFDGSHSRLDTDIALAGDARLLFADVTCFGRPGSGERFCNGRWRQRMAIRRDDRLLWQEQAVLGGGDPLLQAPAGLGGATVCGSLLWVGEPLPAELHEACRALPFAGRSGVTQLPGLWLARCLCDSAEAAHAWLRAVWALLRPVLLGRAAVPPRIWAT